MGSVGAETSSAVNALYDISALDPEGKYRAWLQDAFVVDHACQVDSGDILLALQAKFAEDANSNTASLTIEALVLLIRESFTEKMFVSVGTDGGVVSIDPLRWKALPVGCTRSLSVHCAPENYPEWLRVEAHKLLYLSTNGRARAWLRMSFEEKRGVTIGWRSLWGFYCVAFARSRDTHALVDEAQFLRILKREFRGVEEVVVSENHTVIRDLGLRAECLLAKEYLRLERQVEFGRRVAEGKIRPAQHPNPFNQSLREDPLLALPSRPRPRGPSTVHSEQEAADAAGPVTQRLRRRAQNPLLPLGDEEPGFPGESVKAEQKLYKRKFEAFKKRAQAALLPDHLPTAGGQVYPFVIDRRGPRSVLTWERGPPPGTKLTGYEASGPLQPSDATATEKREVTGGDFQLRSMTVTEESDVD